MSMFNEALPINPDGVWEMHEDTHEFIFQHHVMEGFSYDLTFDYHLPICKRDEPELIIDLDLFLSDTTQGGVVGNLPSPKLKDKQEYWLAISGMQKAIRRGDFLHAWMACAALVNDGKSGAMWRRLTIICLEDIGPGDPYLIALCMRASTKQMTLKISELILLRYILSRACAAPKSRDLCDMATWSLMDDAIMIRKETAGAAFNLADQAQLIALASHLAKPLKNRLAALWRISGKWQDVGQLDLPKIKPAIDEFAKATGIPPLFRYIMSHAIKLGDAMPLVLPFVWQMVCASTWAHTNKDLYWNYMDTKMVGTYYAASLDKHTWAGSSALKRFAKHLPIRNWLAAHPHVDAMYALGRAVFYVEGGLLNPRLLYEGEIDLYTDILRDKIKLNGFASYREGLQFYDLVGNNIAALHECRNL